VVGGGAALVSLVLATLPPASTAPLFEAAEDFARHFFVGGFAAAVGCASRHRQRAAALTRSSTAVVYPLDVLKTRMQLQPARWPSALACGAEAVREGGLPALYAGMATNLVGVAPEKSLKIMAYTACHSQLLVLLGAPPSAELPFAWEAAAGAAAGAAQAIIACPLEAAKIPMQAAARGAARPRMASVVASLGFSGLFRGFDICLARDTLTSGLFFAVFAWAKVALAEAAMRAGMDPPIPFVLKLLAGGFAGVPAALLTTPLDVVKTRLQAPEGRDADALQCAMRTVREEGAWALWCGAGERVARLSPQLGISLALYEILEGLE